MEGEGTPERPLSVLHVCAPAEVGGLERVVQGLSLGLAHRGHEVAVAAVVEKGADMDPLFRPLRGSSIRTFTIELGGRAYLRERKEVAGILTDLRPDVLHTHGYRPDLLHGGTARRQGIATVTTLHGSSRMGGLSHLFEWWQERSLRRFDGVVAVSLPLVDVLVAKGVSRERIHYIPNAWVPPANPLERDEASRFLGLPSGGPPIIGWVGRLIPIKGADVFIDALDLLKSRGWLAAIVGDGPERAALEERSRGLGLDDRIRFLGAIPEAARYFSAFDAFVLSSRSEGTPMVLLEALGAGLPVVSTSVGGVPVVLDGEEGGWLCPPERPEELAKAIGALLSDPDEASVRSRNGSARIRAEFDEHAWIRGHERAYRSALGGAASGGGLAAGSTR